MTKKKIPEKTRISVLNRDSLECLWCGRSSADGITAKEGEPFTFKIKLTKNGKLLLENIRRINVLSE